MSSTTAPSRSPDSPLARHRAPLDDAAFLAAFERAAIPLDRWDHVAHVRAARLLLAHRPFVAAVSAMRAGIRRLNRDNGVLETNESGYHETLTIAWMTLVAAAHARDPGTSSLDFWIRHRALHDPREVLRFYSRERLRTREARARFVPPDLAPLPSVWDGADSCEARGR